MENEKFMRMTTAPVEKLVCSLAIPSIISMMITAFYNMADTFFVGRVGTSATAAVGIAFPLMSVVQALSFFFGHGAGNYISRKLGATETDKALYMGSTGFMSAFIILTIISILSLIFLSPLARLLGATETIFPHAKAYLIYILIGTPVIGCSYVINNLLRFQGNAFYGMIGMSIGAFINIFLDPLFIFSFKMGAAGAGLATLIGQSISLITLLILNNRKSTVKLSLKYVKFSTSNFLEITRGGIPSLCRQGLSAIATIVLNNIAGGYGDAAIAAISIVGRIGMMSLSAVIGFGQGFQPVCGFNYGAKKYLRVKKAYRFSVIITTVILTVIAIFAYIFAKNLITLFRNDKEVIEIGTLALKFQCFALPLLGFNTMSNMFLQTIGKAIPATIVAMSRQFLFFIPSLFVLTYFYKLVGLQLTQPISDLISFFFAFPITISVLRKMK